MKNWSILVFWTIESSLDGCIVVFDIRFIYLMFLKINRRLWHYCRRHPRDGVVNTMYAWVSCRVRDRSHFPWRLTYPVCQWWEDVSSSPPQSYTCQYQLISPWTRWPPFWQTIFSNAFSWTKILEFQFKFHWNLFPTVQLTISQHWCR